MSRLSWGLVGEREIETGIDRGVFYPLNSVGHAWDGLVSVTESSSDTDSSSRYLDGQKIADSRRQGSFTAKVEAFTYPTVFTQGMSTPQRRSHFSMTYRVAVDDHYKIHLIYNALATPDEKNFVYDDISPFSWNLTTRGMPMSGATAVSHLVIDTKDAYSWTVEALEDIIYGSDNNDPRMPTPAEVLEIFEENSLLRIIDNGDGTWTAIGSDDIVSMIDSTTFQINWPTVVLLDEYTYTVHSL